MKQRGFTLLELLLVLSVLVALAAVGMSAYQLQQRNFGVDKTALQMQQWLQAGMAFYVTCNNWPTDVKQVMGEEILTSTTCSPKANQSIQFLPSGSDQNGPWNNNTYSIVPPAANQQFFTIQTVLENQDNEARANVIGQSIASRLPNAQAVYDKTNQQETITAQVSIPGQAINNNSNVIIQQIYYRTVTNGNPNTSVPIPQSCPSGMQPDVYAAIAGFKPPYDGGIKSSVLFDNAEISCSQPDSTNYNVAFNAVGGANDAMVSNNATMMIITVCEKPGSNTQSCLSSSNSSNSNFSSVSKF